MLGNNNERVYKYLDDMQAGSSRGEPHATTSSCTPELGLVGVFGATGKIGQATACLAL
jgi:hypothetical protein